MKKPFINPTLQTIAKWLVLVGASIYLLLFTDTLDAFSLIVNIDGFYFFLFLMLGLGNRLLNASRIKQICSFLTRTHNLNLKKSLRIFLFSEFVSVIIPTSYSAEAIRIFKLSQCNLSFKLSSLAVLIDRSIGFMVMCFITFLVFLVSDIIPAKTIFLNSEFATSFIVIIIVLTIIFSAVIFYFRKKLLKWLFIFKGMFRIDQVMKVLLTSLLVYASVIGTYYYAFMASGVELTTAYVVFIVFLSFVAKLIPFSFLGVTAGELTQVVVSEYFGVSHELALLTVMIIILGKYIFSVFGFLIELYCDGIAVISENLKMSAKNI